MVQAGVDTPRYWKTAEHRKYSTDSKADRLFSWLEEYESFNNTFSGRNKLAFRFANRDSDIWWERLALFAAEPELWGRHRDAIVHLASARYTQLSGPESLVNCLRSPEPRVVEGMLVLLPSLRSLKMDGSDSAWPQVAPLDPQVLSFHVTQALNSHPQFGALAARALAGYGTSAAGQARALVPLLISDDAEIAAAAKSAIREIDPSGIAAKLNLQDGVSVKAEQVKEFLATTSEPEPGLSSHPRFSKQFSALLKLFKERTQHTTLPPQDPAGDTRFLETATPDEWWPVLIAASLDWEFREYHSAYLVQQVARALYMKSGSPEVLMRLVQSDDPKVAAGALQLISKMRHYKDESSHYLEGALVDSTVMPGHFAKLLEQHPALCIYVAQSLAAYGSQAQEQASAIVPYLLSDAPEIVWEVRRTLTTIDPDLANELECQLSDEEFQEFLMEFTDACVLDARQRIFVERYLEARKTVTPTSSIFQSTLKSRINNPEIPDRARVTLRNRPDQTRPTRPETSPITRRVPPGQRTVQELVDPQDANSLLTPPPSELDSPQRLQHRAPPTNGRVRRQPPQSNRPSNDPLSSGEVE